ncbi:hypothetical protein [Accumulibacter sp.]|uniref:hypothetical protein n=1 Tax=Accumulibacter sp. TaxID=2053492 RepID=UPI002583A70D|nr:hypothetical protein [Accumulibacter sp.]
MQQNHLPLTNGWCTKRIKRSKPMQDRQVDKGSIGDFEKDLKGNLYKIWNRMSSGSYFPPPVKAVAIPKKNGGERMLVFNGGRSCGADGGQAGDRARDGSQVSRIPTVIGPEDRRWTPWG